MSSTKKSRDAGKKPSVFERLGSKPLLSSTTEDYCKQWAHKGTCSYGSKCKFINTHNSKNKAPSTSGARESRKDKRSRSRSQNRRESSTKQKTALKVVSKNGKAQDADSGDWEKSLEHEDELALERKLQMLQRELAKEDQEHKGKGKKTPLKKRGRSSSSSSTSSSSTSDSSSESSDSSSSTSGTTSSSSSSSSDSDGEVKDKKPAKKKYDRGVKRSHSSSSKSKSRPKKIAKISHSDVSRKKDSSSLSKKQSHRSHSHNLTTSSTRHHASSSNGKHSRESPSYSPAIRSRSPRVKDSEVARDRRLRRSPEMNEAKRAKLIAPPLSRGDGRTRDRKLAAIYESRGKMEKSRDRLLEPNYMIRSRSPTYREPYILRDVSPTPSFRDRVPRVDPYDSRRGYSPPASKLERKDDPYDLHRLRRPVSPESLRRPSTRSKEYHEYERDWPVAETSKITDWDHPDYRRSRNRTLDNVSWNRSTSAADMTWKKSFSPPPTSTSHAYNWESPHQPPPLTRINEHKRDREKRSDSHRSRESRRNAEQLVSTKATVSEAAPLEDGRSSASTEEVVAKPLPPVQSDGEAEEARPLSAVVEVDESIEGFSDFSDDVDEILNRDIQEEPKSDKAEEPAESESEPSNAPAELELNPNSLPASTHSIINSPKVFSPLPAVVVDSRADEDLLGGMDIEQVSDEELEEEGKSIPVDALDVDWASLACKREKKVESSGMSARQRWEGKEVLARLGILSTGQKPKPEERKPLFDTSSLFRRALSARMDLSFRRTLCGLPARELIIDHCDVDVNLYKATVDLLLKERVAAT